jgi:hypothetical protein
VPGFTGRLAQLDQLDALLAKRGPTDTGTAIVISAISGTAGIGKTALAVHWAHRVRDRFPDGQLYANLRGFDPSRPPTPPNDVIRQFLDALGVPAHRVPADPDAQINLYRSLLADRRVLVVLDNVREPGQARPLLPGAPGCVAVVTSRHRLTGLVAIDGAHPVSLDLLAADEARQLVASRLGTERVAAEAVAVDELIELCGRLPLALAVAVARAANDPHRSIADLVVELRDARGRLDALTGDDAPTDIRAVFACSYRTLSPDAARLFRLLGLHPGPDLGIRAAASLAGVSPARARQLLTELAAVHLVTEHARDRYLLHDLIRRYAEERTQIDDAERERHAAISRLFDHYLHTAYTAAPEPVKIFETRSF